MPLIGLMSGIVLTTWCITPAANAPYQLAKLFICIPGFVPEKNLMAKLMPTTH